MGKAPADNLFAKILAGELPSHCVYDNQHVYGFLDIYPQAPGHTLVIPRNYSPNLLEVEPADLQHCLAAVRQLMPAIKLATGARGITVLTNTGREAGQMVEYLHFHILPRTPDDAVSLGILGDQAESELLAEMAEKIRSNLTTETH